MVYLANLIDRIHPEPLYYLFLEKMLEVCIDSLESAINAILGGADELEVCSSLPEGGLTPSVGLVAQITSIVNNIKDGKPLHKLFGQRQERVTKVPKINVMIRCRSGSDFRYNNLEMETMLSDVENLKRFQIDRFVFGALTMAQEIDEENCQKIIDKAYPLPVTFHRAFDLCKDPKEAIVKLIDLGFTRLLTSGQRSTAADPEALEIIKTLLSFSDKIEIMPGAGINVENAEQFIKMGCKILHSSCKKVRHYKVEGHLNMGTQDNEGVYITDEDIVKTMKSIINN